MPEVESELLSQILKQRTFDVQTENLGGDYLNLLTDITKLCSYFKPKKVPLSNPNRSKNKNVKRRPLSEKETPSEETHLPRFEPTLSHQNKNSGSFYPTTFPGIYLNKVYNSMINFDQPSPINNLRENLKKYFIDNMFNRPGSVVGDQKATSALATNTPVSTFNSITDAKVERSTSKFKEGREFGSEEISGDDPTFVITTPDIEPFIPNQEPLNLDPKQMLGLDSESFFPSFGPAKPTQELTEPSRVLSTPYQELPKPTTALYKPNREISKPKHGLPKPSTFKPNTGLFQPKQGSPKLSTELFASNTELSQPKQGLPKLSTELFEPNTELFQPKQDLPKLSTELSGPNRELSQPNTELNEPNTEVNQPSRGQSHLKSRPPLPKRTQKVKPTTAPVDSVEIIEMDI